MRATDSNRNHGESGRQARRSSAAGSSDRKPSRERRGYGDSKFSGERKSYGDRKSFGHRSFGKSYGESRPSGEGGASGRRGFGKDNFSDRKPSGGRTGFGGRQSYGDRQGQGGRPYRKEGNFSERPIRRRRSEIEEIRNELNELDNLPVEKKPVYRAKAQEYTPKPRMPKIGGEDGVRLNKFIANSGICSRREADEFISAGVVSVNGQIVTELGTKVFSNDVVKFNDETVKGEEKVYIIMNKPKDFVTTTADPHADKTVIDLVAGKCRQRVYPVGRLDKDTTGVLLLTNDGDLTEKLTHPSYEKKKIYQVFLDKNLKRADFDEIMKGVKLEDGIARADALSYIDGDETQVGIEIHNGKNRIVRRIFDALGYKVRRLDRVYFAGLTKKGLRRGQWRFLTDKEVGMLMMGSYE